MKHAMFVLPLKTTKPMNFCGRIQEAAFKYVWQLGLLISEVTPFTPSGWFLSAASFLSIFSSSPSAQQLPPGLLSLFSF